MPGKVFARIILDKVCHHLLEHQCPEQSCFTPKRSTIDRILALREHMREDESPSFQVLGASSLALWMQNLDSDQGSETET